MEEDALGGPALVALGVDVLPANWPKSIVSHDHRPKKAYYQLAQINQPLVALRNAARQALIERYDSLIAGGRYHNSKDFMRFPRLGKKKFYYEPYITVAHRDIQAGRSILSAIKKKDVMLHFPYHSFDHFIDLLRESSIDPYVTSIQITLYRLARNSSVINALMNAARNGKSVTTVVELQARFDEEANILWGNKLLSAAATLALLLEQLL